MGSKYSKQYTHKTCDKCNGNNIKRIKKLYEINMLPSPDNYLFKCNQCNHMFTVNSNRICRTAQIEENKKRNENISCQKANPLGK